MWTGTRTRRALGLVLVTALLWAGAGGARGAAKDKVTLQLKWVAQAQFAGYYAAREKGFYDAAGLDLTVKPGGPDIIPEQVVAGGGAQFGIDWLPSLLSAREQGTPLINVAQVFQYSGMREIAFKSTGIKTVNDLRGGRSPSGSAAMSSNCSPPSISTISTGTKILPW